jgi:trimethylamine---corrinoid protein Co-methyltransferase
MINRKLKAVDIFSEDEIRQIHQATLTILEKHGIEVFHEEGRALLQKHGAKVEGVKVYFPRALVEEQLALAPSQFTLHARNPDKERCGRRKRHRDGPWLRISLCDGFS